MPRVCFEHDLKDPRSSQTWWYAQRLAAQHGKQLFDPYLHPAVYEYFLQFHHHQVSPPKKPLVRQALAQELGDLADNGLAVGVRLQIGGGVNQLFSKLLTDPSINRFQKKYRSVSQLCQRWAREVEGDPKPFQAELARLPDRLRATSTRMLPGEYRPYTMSDVRRSSLVPKFNVISMFSGGGGSSIGYGLAGGAVLAANEFVPEAARTYETNFPHCLVDRRDIREIIEGEGVEAFLARVGLRPGELDIIDGSPPCSEFSIAGRGIRESDELRSYSDVKQRDISSLPFDFVRTAMVMRPKLVILENVPGLAFKRSRAILEAILRALRFENGDGSDRVYFANWKVLAASDFGVPQARRRLFILGIRRDVGEAIQIRDDREVSQLFPASTHLPVSIRSAFANLQQTYEQILPWSTSAMGTALDAAVRRLPKNPARRTRPYHVTPGARENFTLTRCAWDLPAPTLVVAAQGPDGRSGSIHPDQDRKFTIPELKRLFALPDDFILTGTLRQAAERICRMVPPPLTREIATSVYEHALRPYAETHR